MFAKKDPSIILKQKNYKINKKGFLCIPKNKKDPESKSKRKLQQIKKTTSEFQKKVIEVQMPYNDLIIEYYLKNKNFHLIKKFNCSKLLEKRKRELMFLYDKT